MSKLVFTLAGTAAAALAAAIVPMPAMAQASDRISEVEVFGNDPCPRSTDDEVVVCARKPESERYRIPERLRPTGPRQSGEAWAYRARALETVGATGINSCSPVGPGGFTGCLTKVIRQAQGERAEVDEADTAPEQ